MTVRQIQNLLQYLGYYAPPLIPDDDPGQGTDQAVRDFQAAYGLDEDGIPGAATQAALRDAVAHGLPVLDDLGEGNVPDPAPEPVGPAGLVWSRYPHFTQVELHCRCGGRFCNGWPHDINPTLMEAAEWIRRQPGVRAVCPTSVLRCKRHNAAQRGSVPNSQHLAGNAMDFYIPGWPASRTMALALQAPGIKFAYCIDRDCVHMDTVQR